MAGILDDDRYTDCRYCGCEREGLDNMASLHYRVVLHHLKIGVKVRLDRGVEDGKIEEGNAATGDYVAVCQETQ